jgi:adenylate kinase
MLRERIALGTPAGLRAKPYVERGDLVPDSLMVEMVLERLSDPDAHAGFLLDGFPRTLAQAQALDNALQKIGQKIDRVLLLEVPEEEIVRRLGGRWTCSNADCGSVYNLPAQPPRVEGVCDRCNAPLVQREDDKPETIRRRLRKYHQKTAPVIEYYRKSELVRTIEGQGNVEQVHQGICNALGAREA